METIAEVVELEIPARPEFVALSRLVVSAMASADPTLSDDQVDDLKIAVSEACTNAIEAHDAIATDERGLRVSVEDRGPGFDPSTLPDHPPPTDPDRLKFERGLGIPLIRALVDELEISSSKAGTEVRMAMWHANGAALP